MSVYSYRLALGLAVTFLAPWVSMESKAADIRFQSGIAEYDEAYLKAVHVIAADIKDQKFLAGESWAQVWTRDTAYSMDLACTLLHPDVSKNTLLGLMEDIPGIGPVWAQDICGHFGGWPALTDAIVGAMGAWSLYEYTADADLLAVSYQVTVNSLKRAERDAFDPATSLFKGCSSFMESNSAYPKKYASNGELLAQTKALSTNLLYYNGYRIAARMGKILKKDVREFEAKAEQLKTAINQRFWLPNKGYYGLLNETMEATGEAFAILFDVADAGQKASIMKHTPTTANGMPSLWPQFPEHLDYNQAMSEYYHNGMIWPFVQGYWARAAAVSQNTLNFSKELKILTRLSQKNDTFMEFYRPENGQPDGSRRQLWSASGYLSMIYHGLFGIRMQLDGIRFAPVVPEAFSMMSLEGLKFHNMTLSIKVKGHGTRITAFRIDDLVQSEAFVPMNLVGEHRVSIDLQ
jgi:hypothetical protein